VQKEVQSCWSDDNRRQYYQIAAIVECGSRSFPNHYGYFVKDDATMAFYEGHGWYFAFAIRNQ